MKLFTMGDSISQGFISLTAARTDQQLEAITKVDLSHASKTGRLVR